MLPKMKTYDFEAILEYELQNGCHRRPAKRKALWLAMVFSQERFTPDELTSAKWTMYELLRRINKVRL